MDLFRHFGLDENPFADPAPFESAEFKEVREAVHRTIRERGWLLLSGTPGSGKTFAAYDALARAENCRVVRTLGGNRRWYHVNHIDQALFEDLTDERPRSAREARRRQLERILGQISREQDICVLIDEATVLPRQTLTEIKHMRDSLRFGADPRDPRRPDRRPLFSVVMIGWPSLEDEIARSAELRPRIRRKRMQGLARSEVAAFVRHLGLARIAPKAVCDALADNSRFPLAIMDRLIEAMERAYARGARVLDVEDVAMNVSDLYRLTRQTGVTLKAIAEANDISVTTAHQIVNGAYPALRATARRKVEEVTKFLQEKLAEQREQAVAS